MLNEKDLLNKIIQDQLRRYSGFQIRDLYKLIYQICLGGHHLMTNPTMAKKALLEEWKTLDKVNKGEPMLEIIDPLGEVMRVNLRVYRKIGGTPESLFRIMKESVSHFIVSRDRFIRYWDKVMYLSEKEEILFSHGDLEDFWIDMGRKDFPAIHHSDSYTERNRPAYRVILKSYWES
jgi:hypothetical protein